MLAKEFNSHSASGTWRADRTIEITMTGFVRDVHHVGQDANGENILAELQTAKLNASQVQFRSNRGLLNIYALVPSNGCAHGGKKLDKRWLVELRDVKGKKHTFQVDEDYEHSKSNPLAFILNVHDDQSKKRLDNILGNWRHGGASELEKLLPEGWRIVTCFEFNLKLWFVPKGIKRTKAGVTIAYETNGTYQSLPCIVELKKGSSTKVVSLVEHGVEVRGYYSHDTRLTIRPEQLQAAKKLAAKVKRMAAQTLKEAKS